MIAITKTLNEITLESDAATTQAAASRVQVDTQINEQLNFSCYYTTGSAETSNTCSIIVEGYDGTNWVQVGAYAISTGDATFTPTIFKIAGAAAATTYEAHFHFDIVFTKIRFGAYEAGVAANKGTLTIVALVQ